MSVGSKQGTGSAIKLDGMKRDEIGRFFKMLDRMPGTCAALGKDGNIDMITARRVVLVRMRMNGEDGAVTNWKDIEKFASATEKLAEEQETRIFQALHKIVPNSKNADGDARALFWQTANEISRYIEEGKDAETLVKFLEAEAAKTTHSLKEIKAGIGELQPTCERPTREGVGFLM